MGRGPKVCSRHLGQMTNMAATLQKSPEPAVWICCQQFFSHVRTEPPLPGYYQYFWGSNCVFAQGHNEKVKTVDFQKLLQPVT